MATLTTCVEILEIGVQIILHPSLFLQHSNFVFDRETEIKDREKKSKCRHIVTSLRAAFPCSLFQSSFLMSNVTHHKKDQKGNLSSGNGKGVNLVIFAGLPAFEKPAYTYMLIWM